jgi:hypothetical protein
MKSIPALFFLSCVSAGTLFGGSVTLGVDNGGNVFPFGTPATPSPGTRYQEAYASTYFSSPISITGIDFFLQEGGAGSLYSGTYTLSLSTIAAGVGTLSPTNFDSNLGANNAVFETVALSGAAPSTLSFTGGPFNYDPSQGNLLLDIQISNGSAGNPVAQFQDGNGTGPSTIVRYQNFGSSVSPGFGLVTRFDFTTTTSDVPEPGTWTLLGCGLAGLFVRRFRR